MRGTTATADLVPTSGPPKGPCWACVLRASFGGGGVIPRSGFHVCLGPNFSDRGRTWSLTHLMPVTREVHPLFSEAS